MSGWTILLLLAQAACALLGLGVLGLRVLPALAAGGNPGGSVLPDVWVPLAIVGPMLVLTGAIGDSVEGTGWIPIAAPVCVGLGGVGAALAWSAGARPLEPPARMLATAAGAGVVFLLLGAVDELAIWTGQCVFALAIVMLWINTPHRAAASGGPGRGATGAWSAVALLLAAGQGVCCLLAGDRAGPAGGAMLVAYAGAATVLAVHRAGPDPAVRIAMWSAALGTLLGIGTLSFMHLAPGSFAIAIGKGTDVTMYVAYGFGAYAVEGLFLTLLPAVALGGRRLRGGPRRALGFTVVAAAAALALWRLADL